VSHSVKQSTLSVCVSTETVLLSSLITLSVCVSVETVLHSSPTGCLQTGKATLGKMRLSANKTAVNHVNVFRVDKTTVLCTIGTGKVARYGPETDAVVLQGVVDADSDDVDVLNEGRRLSYNVKQIKYVIESSTLTL